MSTKIEWCDETVNVVSGCTPISGGCQSCYSRAMIKRFAGKPGWPKGPGEVTLFPERLETPFKWKKPKRIFVPSMSDLFHDKVPNEYIAAVFGMMAETPHHTYLVLTKRARRMLAWFEWLQSIRVPNSEAYLTSIDHCLRSLSLYQTNTYTDPDMREMAISKKWPLPNVHLGVSCENQVMANERIPLLLRAPAAKRFVSAEPLLRRVNFDSSLGGTRWIGGQRGCGGTHKHSHGHPGCQVPHHHHDDRCASGLDNIIVGAETGHGKRPMNLDWARSIRDQCQAAGVAFFFKKDSEGNHELDGKVWEELA